MEVLRRGGLSEADFIRGKAPTPEEVREHFVDAGAGLLVEKALGCHWSPDGPDDPIPYRLDMQIEYSEESGRYEVTELRIERVAGGPRVTSDGLRSIPVERMLRDLSSLSLWGEVLHWVEDSSGHFISLRWFAPPPRESFGRGRLDDEAYRKIALVHRLNEVLGSRATSSTAEHFGVTTTTVQNWMKEARARGITDQKWVRAEAASGVGTAHDATVRVDQ